MSEANIPQSDTANVSAGPGPVARSTPSIASVTSALQKLNIGKKEYEVLKAMPNKRGVKSWIWDHGVKLKSLFITFVFVFKVSSEISMDVSKMF
jgi:hypothetical protein